MMNKRYKIDDGDWQPFTGRAYKIVIDTSNDHTVCSCYYEKDAKLICKLLNENEKKRKEK